MDGQIQMIPEHLATSGRPVQRQVSPSRPPKGPWLPDLDRRRDVRLRLGEPVILQLTNGTVRSATLESLSLGGLALTGAPAEWKRQWPVTFTLSYKSTRLLVIGSVIWEQNETIGIGFAQRGLDHDLQVQQFLSAFLDPT